MMHVIVQDFGKEQPRIKGRFIAIPRMYIIILRKIHCNPKNVYNYSLLHVEMGRDWWAEKGWDTEQMDTDLGKIGWDTEQVDTDRSGRPLYRLL